MWNANSIGATPQTFARSRTYEWLGTFRPHCQLRSSAWSWLCTTTGVRLISEYDRSSNKRMDGLEVIVVDDGSREAAPEFYPQLGALFSSHNCQTVPRGNFRRQKPRSSDSYNKGAILLFVDADCKLQVDCLAALGSTSAASPVCRRDQANAAADHSLAYRSLRAPIRPAQIGKSPFARDSRG